MSGEGAVPEWRQRDGRVEVRTAHYVLELAEDAGGSIVRASDPQTHVPLLAAPGNEVVSYRDSGGLWRLGHEFHGGSFRERQRSGDRPARFQVRELGCGLELACDVELDGETVCRRLWFQDGSPLIRMRLEGRAAEGHTLTVRFATGLVADRLAMEQPGGVAVRPLQRVYMPTFWPAQRFVHVRDRDSGRGVALLIRHPGAVSCSPDGHLQAIALRNATRERAFGFLPIPATPAVGHERSSYAFEYLCCSPPPGIGRRTGCRSWRVTWPIARGTRQTTPHWGPRWPQRSLSILPMSGSWRPSPPPEGRGSSFASTHLLLLALRLL